MRWLSIVVSGVIALQIFPLICGTSVYYLPVSLSLDLVFFCIDGFLRWHPRPEYIASSLMVVKGEVKLNGYLGIRELVAWSKVTS